MILLLILLWDMGLIFSKTFFSCPLTWGTICPSLDCDSSLLSKFSTTTSYVAARKFSKANVSTWRCAVPRNSLAKTKLSLTLLIRLGFNNLTYDNFLGFQKFPNEPSLAWGPQAKLRVRCCPVSLLTLRWQICFLWWSHGTWYNMVVTKA